MIGWVTGKVLPRVIEGSFTNMEEILDELEVYKYKDEKSSIKINDLIKELVERKEYIENLQHFILDCYKNPSQLNNLDMKKQIDDRIKKEEDEEWEMEYKDGLARVAQDLS